MSKLSKREEIIQLAASLFRKRGYSSTSVRDIAREIGMEASSLYNHIRSKQEILNELMLNVANSFCNGMDSIKEAPLNPLQKLERIVALHVNITINEPDAVALIPNEWIHLETEGIQDFLKLRDRYEKDFKQILQDCLDQGFIKPVNIDLASFSILSTLRWLYSWYSKNKDVNVIELEEEMKKCLINGLAK